MPLLASKRTHETSTAWKVFNEHFPGEETVNIIQLLDKATESEKTNVFNDILFTCTRLGKLETIKRLHEKFTLSEDEFCDVLRWAVEYNQIKIVRYLFDNLQCKFRTPKGVELVIETANKRGHTQISEYLRSKYPRHQKKHVHRQSNWGSKKTRKRSFFLCF